MTSRLICPLISSDIDAMRREMALAAKAGAEAVECRLDYLRPVPATDEVARLVADVPVEVIATCRPAREGGNFQGDEADRLALLAAAAEAGADFVDIELDVPQKDWPGAAVIVSQHNFETCPENLHDLGQQLDGSGGAINKIAFMADRPEDSFDALEVIGICKKPTIALAMGEAGLASRIVARKFGAFGTFAALRGGAESAPGQPTLDELKGLYRWDAIDSKTLLFGVIGWPVGHSMSPAIHNAAFAAAGVNGVYVPLGVPPEAEEFNSFMDALLDRPWLDWRGLSVTIPHKENALGYLGKNNCDPAAARIGAINTITIGPEGTLRGDNTDYAAAIDALCRAMDIAPKGLAHKAVAVLGAGGVSRAIVAVLSHYRAEITIYNRTVSRAEALAEEFSTKARPLEAADELEAEILINCTSIGMHPHKVASPLGVSEIPPCVKVVFDTIYNPMETELISQARAAGVLAVSGVEMFVNQAAAQFETWCETPAPRDVMREVLVGKLQQ